MAKDYVEEFSTEAEEGFPYNEITLEDIERSVRAAIGIGAEKVSVGAGGATLYLRQAECQGATFEVLAL